jgi:hypothetical protein
MKKTPTTPTLETLRHLFDPEIPDAKRAETRANENLRIATEAVKQRNALLNRLKRYTGTLEERIEKLQASDRPRVSARLAEEHRGAAGCRDPGTPRRYGREAIITATAEPTRAVGQ